MSKRKAGLFPLLVGAVAGAAAIFFSDEKNRAKAKKTWTEAKKNPEAFAKKTAKQVEVAAKKAAVKAKAGAKKVAVKAKAEIAKKKTAKKSASKS